MCRWQEGIPVLFGNNTAIVRYSRHMLERYFKQEMTPQTLHLAAAIHTSGSSVILRSIWELFDHNT